jgi:hypothetical protein
LNNADAEAWLGIPSLVNISGINTKKWQLDPNNIFIGRPSKWGNPFSTRNFSRALCVAKYTYFLRHNADLLNDIGELESKTLGCFCASSDSPFLCHGLVLRQFYKNFVYNYSMIIFFNLYLNWPGYSFMDLYTIQILFLKHLIHYIFVFFLWWVVRLLQTSIHCNRSLFSTKN